MAMDPVLSVAPGLAGGGIALLFIIYLVIGILSADPGNARMIEIASAIQVGARAFLVREYTYIAVFVVVAAGALAGLNSSSVNWFQVPICFLIGAFLSALCGWIGMSMAVRANVRTANKGREGLNPALRIAFKAGAVMGLIVVSLGILGLSILYLLFTALSTAETPQARQKEALVYLAGFGFGASSIALFARVGGGIFTKAADVGADLVGKVEAGIPEDDPRNPAVIADNVGDNVGDVAGMGADLFESYVGSIIASATLGQDYFIDAASGVAVPFWISGFGIICSIIGTMLVRTNRDKATQEQLLTAIRTGIFSAAALIVGVTLLIVNLPGVINLTVVTIDGVTVDVRWNVFGCVMIGLVAGILIGTATEYYTSFAYFPTKSISQAGVTGGATVIIQGLGMGMLSTVAPVLTVVVAIVGSYALCETFGVAISAVGMLSTLGITLATDAYGPVADNAGGIAEMAELEEEVRERTDALDALGNTTAATGKGFAIGSAVLTALSLLAAFATAAGGDESTAVGGRTAALEVNVTNPGVMAGVLIGALLPYVFAAFTMLAVGKAAMGIIEEVRRQFHNIPGLMEGTQKPEYDVCVAISTKAACKEMVIPGALAVISPVICGFILGSRGLAGMLTGAISSGFLLAVTMANAGGAWDNAKKYVEAGGMGSDHRKGSECHKAVVIGDTVGDPFKDTSGPALNILIKLMSVVALVLQQAGTADNKLFNKDSIGSANGDNTKAWIGFVLFGIFMIFYAIFSYFNQDKKGSRDYAMVVRDQTHEESGSIMADQDH